MIYMNMDAQSSHPLSTPALSYLPSYRTKPSGSEEVGSVTIHSLGMVREGLFSQYTSRGPGMLQSRIPTCILTDWL
jgi:hypothetical protein